MVVLEALEVTAGYGPLPVIQGVTVRVSAGAIAVVVGPNGSGKSTLLKTIVGLLKPTLGSIHLDGTSVGGWRPYRIARLGMGYVPQVNNVFPSLSIVENLEIGATGVGGEAAGAIEAVLTDFPDLDEARHKKGGQLSGGQRNLLGLARALVNRPKAMLIDEPTAGLAPANSARVWEQIVRIRTAGIGVVVVEQNVDAALAHADWVFVMANGRLQLEGAPSDISSSQLDDIFLGRAAEAADLTTATPSEVRLRAAQAQGGSGHADS
jgi:ABC-type branched-subunit amino acid transport system ATPase component